MSQLESGALGSEHRALCLKGTCALLHTACGLSACGSRTSGSGSPWERLRAWVSGARRHLQRTVVLLRPGDLSARPRGAPLRTSHLCHWLGSTGHRGDRSMGRGASPPPPSWTFNVTGLLPPRFLVHSQLCIAPGPAGMGPVTWLFSQPSSVTRGCFCFRHCY